MNSASTFQLNILCTLWKKPQHRSQEKDYGPEHVNTLHKMLQKQITTAFKLWCVCDDDTGISSNIECIPFPSNVVRMPAEYPKLWPLSAEFADIVGHGRQFLFTDLDVVIVGDLSSMVSTSDTYRFRSNYPVPHEGPTY